MRCCFRSSLLIQVIGVKDQRLSACVKHSAVGLLGLARAGDVIHFRNVEIPRTHQVPDVAIMREEFVLLVERYFAVVKQTIEIVDFGIQSLGTRGILS